METHQCARFCEDPKALHEWGVRHIGKYLPGTKDCGIIFKPNKSKGLECFVDAGFVGGWQNVDVDNPENIYQEQAMQHSMLTVVMCQQLLPVRNYIFLSRGSYINCSTT